MKRRSGKPWPGVAPGTSNPSPSRTSSQECVLVLDEAAFARLPLPLSNPERVVLITRKDPQTLAEAWDAGIVSVVSDDRPAEHRPARDHGRGVACGKIQQFEWNFPQPQHRALRHLPHKIRLQGPNVVKFNSLQVGKCGRFACTTVDSGKEEPSMERSLAELESIVRNRVCHVCTERTADRGLRAGETLQLARFFSFSRRWRKPFSR